MLKKPFPFMCGVGLLGRLGLWPDAEGLERIWLFLRRGGVRFTHFCQRGVSVLKSLKMPASSRACFWMPDEVISGGLSFL